MLTSRAYSPGSGRPPFEMVWVPIAIQMQLDRNQLFVPKYQVVDATHSGKPRIGPASRPALARDK